MSRVHIKNNKRENKYKKIREIREYDCIWRQKAAVWRHIKIRRCARRIVPLCSSAVFGEVYVFMNLVSKGLQTVRVKQVQQEETVLFL